MRNTALNAVVAMHRMGLVAICISKGVGVGAEFEGFEGAGADV